MSELKAYIGPAPDEKGLADYYLKPDADKVIAEKDKEIAELKARIQLDDDEMEGFLQLEEECGGGDLRKYIAELKAENARLKKCEIWMKQHFYCEEVIACESAKNRQLKRALWLARAELCRRLDVDRYLRNHNNSWYNENFLTWYDACVAMEVKMCKAERKCRAKAEEYK